MGQRVVVTGKMRVAGMEAAGHRRGMAARPVLAMRHHKLGLPAEILCTPDHIGVHMLSFGSPRLGMGAASRTLQDKNQHHFQRILQADTHPE